MSLETPVFTCHFMLKWVLVAISQSLVNLFITDPEPYPNLNLSKPMPKLNLMQKFEEYTTKQLDLYSVWWGTSTAIQIKFTKASHYLSRAILHAFSHPSTAMTIMSVKEPPAKMLIKARSPCFLPADCEVWLHRSKERRAGQVDLADSLTCTKVWVHAVRTYTHTHTVPGPAVFNHRGVFQATPSLRQHWMEWMPPYHKATPSPKNPTHTSLFPPSPTHPPHILTPALSFCRPDTSTDYPLSLFEDYLDQRTGGRDRGRQWRTAVYHRLWVRLKPTTMKAHSSMWPGLLIHLDAQADIITSCQAVKGWRTW